MYKIGDAVFLYPTNSIFIKGLQAKAPKGPMTIVGGPFGESEQYVVTADFYTEPQMFPSSKLRLAPIELGFLVVTLEPLSSKIVREKVEPNENQKVFPLQGDSLLLDQLVFSD